MLTDEDAVITSAERDALEPVIPKPAKEFLATFLEGVRPLPADIGRRLAKNPVTPGDRWTIDAGRSGWFETSIDGFVLAGAGCSENVAAMASVSSEKIVTFASVKEKYFPAPIPYVVREVSRDSHAVGVDVWREKYKRISAPALGIEQTDTHTAKFAWFREFQYDPIEPEMNGEVLGVTDIDRDGLAEVLMLYRFYEGISIELQRYPSIGPGANAIAKFGAGC